MRTAITIFIFIISSLTHAQGIYTDTVTGMTIDYPAGWEYKTFDDEVVFYGEFGNVSIIRQDLNLKMSAAEMVEIHEEDSLEFKELAEVSTNGKVVAINSGRTFIGNLDAYYSNMLFDKEDESDLYQRIRITVTVYKGSVYNFITLPHENMYDEMIADTESFLKNVRFP
jgi:hypothetical protein